MRSGIWSNTGGRPRFGFFASVTVIRLAVTLILNRPVVSNKGAHDPLTRHARLR